MRIRLASVVLICCAMVCTAALSANNAARNSLLRSRDQVADQRRQLEQAYSDLDRKIDELQKQKYSVSRYLTDCDKTIKDLDRAIAAQDAAYRGR